MEEILRYLFFFEFLVGVLTMIGICLTTVLERLKNLPHWLLPLRDVLSAIF